MSEEQRHRGWREWLAGRPLFVAAFLLVLVVAGYHGHAFLGLALVLGLALAAKWALGWRAACAMAAVSLLALGVMAWRQAWAQRGERALLAMPEVVVRAVAVQDAKGREGRWVVPARLDEPCAGQWVWWEGRGPLPMQGVELQARGCFRALEGPRNPGEFDRAAWLRRNGVVAGFLQSDPEARLVSSSWDRWSAAFRHGFRARLTQGLAEDGVGAQVIRAVVMGDKLQDAESLIEAFRYSGSLHVFSVSGMHVAMVATMGWFVLGICGVPRRWAVWVLLPWIFGYAWLTGSSPPAMRAAWMAAVFLAAFALRRQPDLLNTLGAVLLLGTLWDARWLALPGVQLSYGVVAALGLGVSWVSSRLRWLDEPEMHLPRQQTAWWKRLAWRFRRWLAGSLSVSVAAGVGSAPLTAWHFGLLTPVSVLSSLVMVPLVFVLVMVGLASVLLSPISASLSRGINRFNGSLGECLSFSAERFAALPGAYFHVGRRPPPSLWVYDLDRGDGAACFTSGGGSGVLLDCGGRGSFRYQVLPSLRNLRVQPDSVVLSHPDAGHLGGGALVWEALPVKQVVMPVRTARSPAYREWLEKAPQAGLKVWQAAGLRELPMGDGAVLECLRVPAADLEHAVADRRVVVWRLHWRGWRFLWVSDAGLATEQEILDAGMDVRADVILAGRPQGDGSLGDEFLRAVAPRFVVMDVEALPPEQHLDPATIAHWARQGIEWINPDEHGGLTFRVDADGVLQVQACASGREWSVGD